MKLTLQEFITKYTGIKDVGNTIDNKGQCVGLVMVWVENLELKHFWGHAKDLYANAPADEWEKIPESPTFYPIAGDIMVCDNTWGYGYGHTGIVESSSQATDSFTCFEQNYPTGSAPRIVKRTSWKGIIGWLRPKKPAVDIPLRDKLIDWQDAEGKMHEVGWYVREWYIEKQKAIDSAKLIGEKQTIIDSQQTQIAGLQAEAIADAVKFKKLESSYNELVSLYNITKDSEKALKLTIDDLGALLSLAQKPIKEMNFWEFIKVKFRG